MSSKRKSARRFHKGVALIVAMIFVLIFSALGICMATMSGTNVQVAKNHHNLNAAVAAAQSGQEIVRYLLSRVLISSSTHESQYLNAIVTAVQTDLADNKISAVTLSSNGLITATTLNSASGQNFSAQLLIDPNQFDVLQARVTGHSGQSSRTITTSYHIQAYEFPIFNFGLATKGSLDFPNNPTIVAANEAWEADMFIESSGNPIAVHVGGNANFDGDINIGSGAANVDFVGDVNIAGDIGQAAIDNHVSIGAESPEFPVPDAARFLQYATGPIVDSSTDLSKSITLINATIQGGTNPVFNGSVTIQGILYIESPNKVTFGNNVALQGLIVADGNVNNPDPGQNSIDILGNFASQPYPNDAEFDAIRQEEGSSIIAPGFAATFAGNFSTLEGVVAVSGAHFTGNMNAMIKGTIINYAGSSTVIEGNATMNFDRANSVKIPAGFDLYRELDYQPSMYCETGP
jgi:Tfp pilus assembly protein PilX